MANCCPSCLSTDDLIIMKESNFIHHGNVIQFIQCYLSCTNKKLESAQPKICRICYKHYKNLFIFRNKLQPKPEATLLHEDSVIKDEPMECDVETNDAKTGKDDVAITEGITSIAKVQVKELPDYSAINFFSSSTDEDSSDLSFDEEKPLKKKPNKKKSTKKAGLLPEKLCQDLYCFPDKKKRFDCRFCPMYFNIYSHLNRHVLKEHKEDVHAAPTIFERCCQKIYSKPDTSMPIVKCKLCGYQYVEYYEYKLHVFCVHLLKMRFIHCEVCYKTFSTIDTMLQHRKQAHIEFEEGVICNAKEPIRGSMKYRKKTHYYDKQTITQEKLAEFSLHAQNGCIWCGKLFTSKNNLEHHLLKYCDKTKSQASIAGLDKLSRIMNHATDVTACLHCSSTTEKMTRLKLLKFMHNDQQICMSKCYKMCTGNENFDYFYAMMCVVCQGELENEYKIRAEKPGEPTSSTEPVKTSADISDHIDYDHIVPTPSYQCKDCDQLFEEFIRFKTHVKIDHQQEVGVYACEICSQIFYYSSALTHHEAAKHAKQFMNDEFKYTCEFCPEHFVDEEQLRAHIWETHNGKCGKKFKCELCSEIFPRQKELSHHLERSHNSHQDFQILCSLCGIYFSKNAHYQHMRGVHADKTKFNFRCKRCGLVFKTSTERGRHREDVHLNTNKTCAICQKTFLTVEGIFEHSFDHRGFLPFVCPKIDCAFKTKKKRIIQEHLKRLHDIEYNELIHGFRETEAERIKELQNSKTDTTGDLYSNIQHKYKCELCPNSYRVMFYLNQHLIKAHGESKKILVCSMCDRTFRSKKLLWFHAFSHLGYKPYNCMVDNCKRKEFVQKKLYVQHLLEKHSINYEEQIHGLKEEYSVDRILDLVLKK